MASTATLTAVVKNAAGDPLSGKTITWSSSDTAVATIAASGLQTALVTAVGLGSCNVKATVEGVDSNLVPVVVT